MNFNQILNCIKNKLVNLMNIYKKQNSNINKTLKLLIKTQIKFILQYIQLKNKVDITHDDILK